jgi:hypothetical protein
MSVKYATYANRIEDVHPVPDNTQFPRAFSTLLATPDNFVLHRLRSLTNFMELSSS